MAGSTKYETVGQLIFWSYANLAMAHTAVERGQDRYKTFNYVIRAKLFKGLKDGTMSMRSIFDDEKIKIQTGSICNYCGASGDLTLDHIVPRILGGLDDAENLVLACRSCNSAKGTKDLMLWMTKRDQFLPLMVIRRYLKLAFNYCKDRDLLDVSIAEAASIDIPFKLSFLPTKYPKPCELKMNALAN